MLWIEREKSEAWQLFVDSTETKGKFDFYVE